MQQRLLHVCARRIQDQGAPWAGFGTRAIGPSQAPRRRGPCRLCQHLRPGQSRCAGARRVAALWAPWPSRRPANSSQCIQAGDKETGRPKGQRCWCPLILRPVAILGRLVRSFHVTHMRASCTCATQWILGVYSFPPCCVGHVRKPSQANPVEGELFLEAVPPSPARALTVKRGWGWYHTHTPILLLPVWNRNHGSPMSLSHVSSMPDSMPWMSGANAIPVHSKAALLSGGGASRRRLRVRRDWAWRYFRPFRGKCPTPCPNRSWRFPGT